MADLISREALLNGDDVCGVTEYDEDGFSMRYKAVPVEAIRQAPAVDAEPVKHGKWDDSGRYAFGDGSLAIRCSECGCALHEDEYQKYYWNYCPNCGAKMDLEGDK